MVDIEELEQYGRRNSLRFYNVPITKVELNKTDDKIVDICKQHLKIEIALSLLQRIKDWVSRLSDCGCCDSFIESIVSPLGPENNFTRFASGVIFSPFIVLFIFDGVAILKYTTVVHTSLFTMVSRSQFNIDDNKETFTIEISLS
jgi:hypothetical protein